MQFMDFPTYGPSHVLIFIIQLAMSLIVGFKFWRRKGVFSLYEGLISDKIDNYLAVTDRYFYRFTLAIDGEVAYLADEVVMSIDFVLHSCNRLIRLHELRWRAKCSRRRLQLSILCILLLLLLSTICPKITKT